jgi:hypothetical protein
LQERGLESDGSGDVDNDFDGVAHLERAHHPPSPSRACLAITAIGNARASTFLLRAEEVRDQLLVDARLGGDRPSEARS